MFHKFYCLPPAALSTGKGSLPTPPPTTEVPALKKCYLLGSWGGRIGHKQTKQKKKMKKIISGRGECKEQNTVVKLQVMGWAGWSVEAAVRTLTFELRPRWQEQTSM